MRALLICESPKAGITERWSSIAALRFLVAEFGKKYIAAGYREMGNGISSRAGQHEASMIPRAYGHIQNFPICPNGRLSVHTRTNGALLYRTAVRVYREWSVDITKGPRAAPVAGFVGTC